MAGFKPVPCTVKPKTMMGTHSMLIVKNSERKGSTPHTMKGFDLKANCVQTLSGNG